MTPQEMTNEQLVEELVETAQDYTYLDQRIMQAMASCEKCDKDIAKRDGCKSRQQALHAEVLRRLSR